MSSLEDDPQSQNYQGQNSADQYQGDPAGFFNPYQLPTNEGEVTQGPQGLGQPYQQPPGAQLPMFFNPNEFQKQESGVSANLNNGQNGGGTSHWPQQAPSTNGIDNVGYNSGGWGQGGEGLGNHVYDGSHGNDINNHGAYYPPHGGQNQVNENWNPQLQQEGTQHQWGYHLEGPPPPDGGYAYGYQQQPVQGGFVQEERNPESLLNEGIPQGQQPYVHERQLSTPSVSASNDADHESVSSSGGMSGFFHSEEGVDLVNPSVRDNLSDGRNSVGLSGPDIIPSSSQENVVENIGNSYYSGSIGGLEQYGTVGGIQMSQGAIPDLGQNPLSIRPPLCESSDFRTMGNSGGVGAASGGVEQSENIEQNQYFATESQNHIPGENVARFAESFPKEPCNSDISVPDQIGSGEPIFAEQGANEHKQVPIGGLGDINAHPSQPLLPAGMPEVVGQNNLAKPELLPTEEQSHISRPKALSSDLLSDIHEAHHVVDHSESPVSHGRTESNASIGSSGEIPSFSAESNTRQDARSLSQQDLSLPLENQECLNQHVGSVIQGAAQAPAGSSVGSAQYETNQPDLPSEALSSISRQNSKPDIMEVNDGKPENASNNVLLSPKGPSKLVPTHPSFQPVTPHTSAFRSLSGRHTPKQSTEVSPSPPLWSADITSLPGNILLAPVNASQPFPAIHPVPQAPPSSAAPSVSSSQDVASFAASVASVQVPGIPVEAQRLLQQTASDPQTATSTSQITKQLGQMTIGQGVPQSSQLIGSNPTQPSFNFGKGNIPPVQPLPQQVPNSQPQQVQSTTASSQQILPLQQPGLVTPAGSASSQQIPPLPQPGLVTPAGSVPVSTGSIPQRGVVQQPGQPQLIQPQPGQPQQIQPQPGQPQHLPGQPQHLPGQPQPQPGQPQAGYAHQPQLAQPQLGHAQHGQYQGPDGHSYYEQGMPHQQPGQPYSPGYQPGGRGPQPLRADWYNHQGSPYKTQFPPFGGQWGSGYGQTPYSGYGQQQYDPYGRPIPPARQGAGYGRQSPNPANDRRSPHTLDRRSPHSGSEGERPGSRQGYDRPGSRQGKWSQDPYQKSYTDPRWYRGDEYGRRVGYDWQGYNRQDWYDRGRYKDQEYYYKYYQHQRYYQQQRAQNQLKEGTNQSGEAKYDSSGTEDGNYSQFQQESHHQGGGTPDEHQYGSEQSKIYNSGRYNYNQQDSLGYAGSAEGSLSHTYPYEEVTQTVTPPPPERMTPAKFVIPHVVARFSSGGHLIKVLPNMPEDGMPATVEIHSVEQMIQDPDMLAELRGFPGPLVRGETHKADVIGFGTLRARDALNSTEHMDSESVALLWELMVLLCRQNGSILETDVSELLLHNHPMLDYGNKEDEEENHIEQKTSASTNVINRHRETQEFRRYLLYGRKKEALESAMKAGLWGHALLLACKMDPRTHSSVMTRFANSLEGNDPLQTLYQLMSERQPAAVTSCADEKWGDWRPHLAMILSNLRSSDSDLGIRSITSLGDSLSSRGLLHASQFCYLMAQVGFGSYTRKRTKIVLLGSSHSLPFKEFASNLAIQLTEIYEYAQLLGNKHYLLPNFQAYKFLYATRLAECGMPSQALHYCEVIANTIQVSPNHYQQTLVEQVCELADQLKYHDSQYFDGGHLTEPTWLVSLRGILQQIKEGSINPPSKSDTPMPWVNSCSNLSGLEGDSADSQNQDSIPMFNTQSQPLQDQLEQLSNQYQPQTFLTPQQEEASQTYNQNQFNQLNMYDQNQSHDPMHQYGQSQPNIQPQQYSENYNQESQQPPPPLTQESWSGYNQMQHDHSYLGNNQEGYNTNYIPQALSQNADLGASANSNATEYSTTTATDTGGDTTDFGESNASQFDYYAANTNRPRSGTVDSMGRTPSENTITNARTRTVSGSSNISQKSQGREQEEQEVKKPKTSKQDGSGGGWFSGWFKSGPKRPKPKKAHLPDDSNLSIEWDPVKKKWIDKAGGEEEETGPPPPPPSDHELNKMPLPGSEGPPGGAPPPPAGVNKFSSKLSRKQYVDVLSKTGGTSALKVGPSDLLHTLPAPPSTAPVNFYIPGSVPNTLTANTQPVETAKIANPDSEPTTPFDQQGQSQQPQFYYPQSYGQSQPSSSHLAVPQIPQENSNHEPTPPQAPAPSIPVMFNPTQFNQPSTQPSSLAGHRYGSRRQYPNQR